MSKRGLGSLFIVLLLAIAVGGVFNAQRIKDMFLFYQFKPDASIASFAEKSGMNDHGEFLFYASQPSLEDAESFNRQCGAIERSVAILGCYDGEKIYIYNITEPRLAGIRPTTAAHEMLHAAYMRLNENDRNVVDALLDTEYERLKKDPELVERMGYYELAQPGSHYNELHSIIGTEIGSISDDLEEYYHRYFSDRSKVIEQHNQYRALFDQLRARADTLNSQISQMEEGINNKKASYDTQASALQRDISDFNNRANQGEFASQVEFNNERQVLLARSTALDDQRADINATINEYNQLVAELEAIVIETNTLNRSIDSNVEPAPNL